MTARQMDRIKLEAPSAKLRRVPDDFEVKEYDAFTLRPLSTTIGAEITGISLSRTPTLEEREELHRSMLEWKVLIFPSQPMTELEFLAFGRLWGDLMIPAMTKVREIPEIMELAKGPDQRGEENIWHSDQPWQVRPPAITILRALQIPPTGGDTLFADMAAAYDDLPQELSDKLTGLQAENIHPVLWGSHDYGPAHSLSDEEIEERRKKYPPQAHPVIRTHPVTSRKSIYVDIDHTSRIYDVDPELGEDLMDALVRRATVPEYQCRLRWSKDTIAMWDNRTVQHYACSDYWPQVRIMQRMIVAGDIPA
jgi:taurine dioxygenase